MRDSRQNHLFHVRQQPVEGFPGHAGDAAAGGPDLSGLNLGEHRDNSICS